MAVQLQKITEELLIGRWLFADYFELVGEQSAIISIVDDAEVAGKLQTKSVAEGRAAVASSVGPGLKEQCDHDLLCFPLW